MKKILPLLLLSISLLGCGTGLIKAFVETPQLKGIALKSFSAKDKQALFEVALYNPNAFSLPISGMNGDIVLNQLAIGRLNASSEQSLAAHATQLVLLPVKLDPDLLVIALKSVLKHQQAQYVFKGGIMTSVGEIAFSENGKLSIQDLIFALFR